MSPQAGNRSTYTGARIPVGRYLKSAAGTQTRAAFHDLTLADWDFVLRTNLSGTFLCSREAVRYMMNHRGGSIVTLGSVQSVVVSGRGPASYRASKAGILMLTRSIGAEYAEYGTRANSVCAATHIDLSLAPCLIATARLTPPPACRCSCAPGSLGQR